MASASPQTVTNRLTEAFKNVTPNTEILNAACWTDGQTAHPKADYLIDVANAIRLPTTNSVFNGNSLKLGTDTAAASLYQKSGNLAFAHDGLFLKNVDWGHWDAGKDVTIDGNVTVLAPTAARFSSNNDNAGLTFTGVWAGDATTGIEAFDDKSPLQDYTLSLLGDLSRYFGGIRVYKGAVLRLGETVFPGTLKMDNVGGAGVLKTADETTGVTLGTFVLTAGTTLEAQARLVDGTEPATNSGFRVTGALEVTGPIAVTRPSALEGGVSVLSASPELRFPLLTKAAAATGELKLDDFALTNASTSAVIDGLLALAVNTDADTGDTSLELVRKPVVAQLKGTAQTDPSPFTTAGFWSDGEAPHAGAVYASNQKSIRTAYGVEEDAFVGDALVLDSTLVLQSKVVNVPTLYCKSRWDSAANRQVGASIQNWHPNGDTTTNAFAVGGTKALTGRRLVLLDNLAETTVTLNGDGSLVRIDSPVEGAGQLTVSVNDGSRGAYVELAGDNMKWTGRLCAVATIGQTRAAPNYTNTCEVLFRKPEHLGGPLASFDVAAVILQKKAVLHPLETMTWDEPTRGLEIRNLGGGIRADAGVVFTVKNPIRLVGTLGKVGDGTLVLGGEIAVAGNASPVIEVLEGGLRTCAKASVDGLTLAFGARGAIEADVTATGDAATYGLYNVKTDTPFDLTTAPNGRVPVRVALPADYYATASHHVTATICTVSAAAAAKFGPEAFAVARPRRCRTYVTAAANDDGTVTYTAHVDASGIAIFIR